MSANRSIHVVAFDVPFPPDYGGVMDVYYRCRALKLAGYHVTLHCFEYGRGRDHDHSAIADAVFYYDRPTRLQDWFSTVPFIVKTRNAPQLLENLLKDEHAILFEGQHTTFFLDHPALQHRRKIVRLHNIEWQYYRELASRTISLPKKVFFQSEARKLKQHEKLLKHATALACISHSDTLYYRDRFPNEVVYVPVGVELYPAKSEPLNLPPFVLFHGNLGVAENREAANWLLDTLVQQEVPYELILAGKDPDAALTERCRYQEHVSLMANPDEQTMQQLIQSAEVHILITFQQSGIKLKLLNALLSGKPCIATPAMVAGTELEGYCVIVRSPEDLIAALQQLTPLSAEEQESRLRDIRGLFSEKVLVGLVERLFTT